MAGVATTAGIPLLELESDSGETFAVENPATGETIAQVPRMGAAETRRALAKAEEALPAWRSLLAKDRARILRRWADLMLDHEEELAHLLTTEQGKPLAESRVEIQYAASFYEWFGEEAKRVYGDTIPTYATDRRIVVTKHAIGVTAGITPWNFPAAMPTRKSAPALAAGCTMVLKPAEQTPLSALAIARLGLEAGLPEGVFQLVTGAAEDAPVIGAELTGNPLVRKLGFTGSTEVGKLLMAQCAKQVKKVSLELGGNAPFIVFGDADLGCVLRGARDDREHPRRQPRALAQGDHRERRERRLLRRLQHHRAARGERGRGLARRHRGREVPRGDPRGDADRVLRDDDAAVAGVGRDRVAVDPLGLLAEPLEKGGGVRDLDA